MSVRSDPGSRPRSWRRFAAVCAASLMVSGVLAGCGSSIVHRNTFESSPRPAISDDAVAGALQSLDDVTNEANASRDPDVLAKVEANPLLAISTAIYALNAATDPEGTATPPPVGHAKPTAFVPRFADYPQWFVVAAPWVQGEPTRLEVLARDSSSAQWMALIAPEMLPQIDFPTLALDDDGYVIPMTAAQLAALPLPLASLAKDYAAALTSGKADGTLGSLLADPWSKARRADDAAAGKAVGAAATVAGAYTPGTTLTQALRTEDGGALVFFTINETLTYTVSNGYFLKLDDATAKIAGTPQVTGTLTDKSAGQLAVYVPPQASGTARVVAARWDRVGLTAADKPAE